MSGISTELVIRRKQRKGKQNEGKTRKLDDKEMQGFNGVRN